MNDTGAKLTAIAVNCTLKPSPETSNTEGPGPGDAYLDTDEGHEWSETTGKAAAANLLAVARARRANPIPAPPS